MKDYGTTTLLVSIIVCTRDRPRLLPRALRSVLSQGWLRKPGRTRAFEVVVADDGDGPPLDLAAALPGDLAEALLGRVRLFRTGYRGSGAARSEGFDAARGRYVAWCDDHDEWAPDHLETLLGCALDLPEVDLVHGDLEIAIGEEVEAAPSLTPGDDRLARAARIRPSAVVFKASVVHDIGGFYPHLRAHEDLDLWLRLLDHGRCVRHLPVVVGRRHAPPNRVPAAEHARDLRRVLAGHERRLARGTGVPSGGEPRSGGATAEAGPPAPEPPVARTGPVVPFDRATWQEGRRELVWHSVLRADEGYGVVGRALLLALEAAGVDVVMAPGAHAVPRGFERFHGGDAGDPWGRLGFYYSYKVRPGAMRCGRLATYSMWETGRVPRDHVQEINAHSSLHYVPCRQNVESHRACGVRVPLKVLRHGVDAGRFPYLERPRSEREAYTFGTFGDLAPRKGTDVLVRAFLDEFGPQEPVRLLMKSTAPRSGYRGLAPDDDPRVELVGGYADGEALLELLRRMDAFVLPSRGEGFGLCGLEAMATGLPLIATNWSGPAEYLDSADSYPLGYHLVDAGGVKSNNVRYFGPWAEPDYEHLRHLMRRLYENPEEGVLKGRAASARAHEEWTWERVARRLVTDLDVLARGASVDG